MLATMYNRRNMVATTEPNVVASVAEDGLPRAIKSDHLFRRASIYRSSSPSTRLECRAANRRSIQRALRQAQLHLSLRTVDGSIKYRVNCEYDKLGVNGYEQFFRPHVENERWVLTEVNKGVRKIIDDVASRLFPNADWQFDATDWPHFETLTYESPPYSHEIFAGDLTPTSIGYPVDLNEIDAALDCDISTLDAYLHSPDSCSGSTEMLPHTQPSTSSPNTQPAATAAATAVAPQPSSTTLDAEPLEEFFPDLCEVTTTVSSAPQRNERRRKVSVASTRSSSSRYSPYSIDSSNLDPEVAYKEYRIRRDKNNLASQRSRQKRVEKLRQMKDEKETLERRNIELKTLLSSLETQVADYKRMVLMIVSKSA